MIGKRHVLIAACAALVGTTTVKSQTVRVERGTVAGSGAVLLKRRPEILRLRVEVFAEGKSVREALANLSDRRQAVRRRLAELGVQEGAATFGEPRVTTQLRDARQQMIAVLQAQLGDRFKKNRKAGQPEAMVVSAALTADWSLRGQGTEALLIEVAEIRDAVKQADLAGVPGLEKLVGIDADDHTRDQVEAIKAMFANANQGGQSLGEPAFSLVSKISERDRARALAEAFRKARSNGADTARAAGMELGELQSVQSQVQNGGETDNTMEGFAYTVRMPGMAAPAPAEPENAMEAEGPELGAVVYRVIVNASFYLKPTP